MKTNGLYKIRIGDRGIALLMILWVLILLDIIVLQFASSMRVELEITRNFKHTLESYYLARAGIEVARFELMEVASKSKTHGFDPDTGAVDFRSTESDREENALWNRQGTLGNGGYIIDYHAKDSKDDLNYLTRRGNDRKLEDILIECGIEPESSELSMVKRSIIDWQDKDHDLSGPGVGAEDDWYKDNWQGYECKDDDFYTAGELVYIRGLRSEEGDSEEELKEKEQLLSKLYDRVDADPFISYTVRSTNWDPNRETPVKNKKSTHYEVITTGWVKGGLAQRQIKAEFDISKPGDANLLSWTDNYIPLDEIDPNQDLAEDEQF